MLLRLASTPRAGTFGLEVVPNKPSYHSTQEIAEGSESLFDTCTLEQVEVGPMTARL
ncbi:hypothetical protein JCGZ_19159 [Jatropha curcas]|uniref:Uncharacterized protein n=1 Tax=Jatropha curcas TaxID=180498 RepID=A0A067KC52_JATCU|nr:hypothetical protein JCGZ_19159 [Jatropha curcas]